MYCKTMLRVVAYMSVFFLSVTAIIAAKAHAQDTDIPADIIKQIAKLRSGSPKQKVKAAQKLGEMGAKAALATPYLIELLDSQEIYRSLGDKFANFITILDTSGTSVMEESKKALVKIGSPAVELLIKTLTVHARPRVRGNAALVLGGIKSLSAVEPLSTVLLTDKDFEVRMWSAEALGMIGEHWSKDNMKDAVKALIKALKDDSIDVRQKAAYALGRIKDKLAIPALIEALRDNKQDVNAGLALFMITGQRLGDDPQKWQEWWNNNKSIE